MPDMVTGLAAQVDEVVGAMERRCATAASLLEHLQQIAEASPAPEQTRGRKTLLGPSGETTASS